MANEPNEAIILKAYAARNRPDLAGLMSCFADDAVYAFNGRGMGVPGMDAPIQGRAAIEAQMKVFIDTFRFDDWKVMSLISSGDEAVLNWSARVVHLPSGRAEPSEVIDQLKFRDGKIVLLRQHTDTALVMRLTQGI